MSDDWDDDETTAHTSDGKARSNSEAYDVAAEALQSFYERVETLNEEIKERRDDLKEVYAEMKGAGYDKKAFDAASKVIRLSQDKSKMESRQEMKAIATIYLTALGKDEYEDLL